jgi:Aldehyde dehydrogenase family
MELSRDDHLLAHRTGHPRRQYRGHQAVAQCAAIDDPAGGVDQRGSTVAEAIAKANDSPVGLGGSVWETDLERAKDVARRLECGSVWINKHGAIQPNAPFGGVKQSGFGVDGLKEFTIIQAVFC